MSRSDLYLRLPPKDPVKKKKRKGTGATGEGDGFSKGERQYYNNEGDTMKSQYDRDKAPRHGAYWHDSYYNRRKS